MVFSPGGILRSSKVLPSGSGRPTFIPIGELLLRGTAGPSLLANDGLTPPPLQNYSSYQQSLLSTSFIIQVFNQTYYHTKLIHNLHEICLSNN